MLPQVAEGEGAQEGVRHRMGQHVGVGVAPQAPLGRDLDPAQHEGPALDERVDVESQADPGHRVTGAAASGRPRRAAARAAPGAAGRAAGPRAA